MTPNDPDAPPAVGRETGPDRRSVLRLVGLGATAALAGCLGGGDGDDENTPTNTPGGSTPGNGDGIADHETVPLALRSSAPYWHQHDDGEEPVGHAVVVDSLARQHDALGQYDLPDEREGDIQEFLADVDYEDERLVLVESVGPDGCHDEIELGDVRLEDGRLRADAAVVDNSEEGMGCTDAIVYPSALLRVAFEGDPVDEVAVEVTDGWDETGTVVARADDPLPSPDPEDLLGHVRPESDPEPVAPLACDREGVNRHDQWFDEGDVQWGDYEGRGEHYDGPEGTVLSLRVDDLEYEYGDTLRLTLTNVAGEPIETGNRGKYTLQVYTEDGWQDVRVKEGDRYWEYTDEAVSHPPGDGFEWSFELTEAGLVEGTYHDDAEVCPDLEAGRYRFAYFGVLGGAVAAAFDLS